MNTPTQTKNALPVALAAVVALLLTTACGDRPITDVSQERDGRPILKSITATGNYSRPRGSVGLEDIVIADFDTSVPDAFGRASSYPVYAAADCGEPCPAWGLFNDDINDASDTDLRTPAPTVADVTNGGYAGGNYFIATAPNSNTVPDTWNWYGSFVSENFNDGARVWVGIARMGVNVNNELDQEQILTGHSVSADQLVYVGGSPGGDGDRRADQFNDGRSGRPGPFFAEPNANPWVMGYSDVDGGELTIDFVHLSYDQNGNQVYMVTGEDFDPAETPFGPNNLEAGWQDGQFNYVVFWGANPLDNPNAPVLFRIQIAADVQAGATTTVNNAFAPFPKGVADVGNLGSLPGGANAFAAPGTITLDGVGFMSGPTFEVGVYSRESGSFTPVSSQIVITDTTIVDPINGIIDTVSVDTLQGASTFTSPRGGAAVEVTMSADDSGVDFGTNSHVVARFSGVAGSEFLYKEYLTTDKALQSGGTSFGAFNGGGTPSVFRLEGTGAIQFALDSLLVDISRVTPNPPAGFHYQSYLLGAGGSLQRLHAVDLDALGNGQDRIGESEVNGRFGDYNFWVLATEPNSSQLNANGVRNLQVQVSEDYKGKFSGFFPGSGG